MQRAEDYALRNLVVAGETVLEDGILAGKAEGKTMKQDTQLRRGLRNRLGNSDLTPSCGGLFPIIRGRVIPHSLRPTAGLHSIYEKNNHVMSYRCCPGVRIRLCL